MAVQYFEPIIDEIEKKKCVSFVGYLNPRGQLIDYATLTGEKTHCSTKNPASMMFLQFISYVVKGFNPDDLKFFWDEDEHVYQNNKTPGFNDVVKRGFDYYHFYNECSFDAFLRELNTYYESRQSYIKSYLDSGCPLCDMHVYEQLQNDLMHFFKKAYQNRDFFRSIGLTPQVECYDDYVEKHEEEITRKKRIYPRMKNKSPKDFYNDYQIAVLMSYFKDVMVMYMGYDSIERRIKLDSNSSNSFKVITTSCANPNERFYNWQLMDWTIQKVPRMLLNEQEKIFVPENTIASYYQTEKEEILGEEIASIKRERPLTLRREFFRK